MTIRLAIIGLGQIGSSTGLALREYQDKLVRVGYDRRPDVTDKARQMGAIDESRSTPAEAVAEADIVLLALPLDEIPAMLQKIGAHLPPDCVVLDTSPVKEPVARWMNESLPAGRHHIGLVPVLHPGYLHEAVKGIEGARADLFANSLMVIASTADTAAEAVKLASDLTRLMGCQPVFMDLAEVDAAMAAVHILPQLLAAALVNATIDMPGLENAGQLAGRPFAEATAPLFYQDDRLALRDAALLNRENVLRALHSLIASLKHLQQAIAQGDADNLRDQIQRAHRGRQAWWEAREKNDWLSEELDRPRIGGMGDFFGQLIGRPPKDV